MKKYFISLIIILFSVSVMAQKSGNETVIIQTNGVCETCKKLFTEKVPYFKGVVDFSYDIKTSKMSVTYNPKKTTPAEIRKGISDLGYNADDVKANPEARAKLPACCRNPKTNHSGCSHTCGEHKH
jgi:copper chaperone CopZ